jgi:hypothetical protein
MLVCVILSIMSAPRADFVHTTCAPIGMRREDTLPLSGTTRLMRAGSIFQVVAWECGRLARIFSKISCSQWVGEDGQGDGLDNSI